MRKTALTEFHREQGARLVDFAGWEMPLVYTGIIEEHTYTRSHVSAFDVSHMGRLEFRGKDAEAFLQQLCTRKLTEMPVGLSRYSHVCREDGGILDDVIVSRFEDHFGMVCNASNREKLLAWFEKHLAGRDVEIRDLTFDTAMVAIQGPEALDLMKAILPIDLSGLKRYRFMSGEFLGQPFTVYRSGYTGEDGGEIVLPAGMAAMAAAVLLTKSAEVGKAVKLAGLGARDTLRLEAGMPLYGHELTEEWDSISAGQKWCVDLTKDFIGKPVLERVAAEGPQRTMCGFALEGKRAARQGTTILSQDGTETVGQVTSGAFAPTVDKVIAMGLVRSDLAEPGTTVTMDLRGKHAPATVVSLPFYKR